jgi:hypothetical protein
MEEIELQHAPDQWRLFIDSSVFTTLWKKAPHAVRMKETYASIQGLPEKIFYEDHRWNTVQAPYNAQRSLYLKCTFEKSTFLCFQQTIFDIYSKTPLMCFGFGVFLHGVRNEFSDDVSKTAVGPIFTGYELKCKYIGQHTNTFSQF